MRKKIFVVTEKLTFFYRLNTELNRLNITFKVLNLRDKIPNIPAIVLTTLEEEGCFKNVNLSKVVLLPYTEKINFKKYIFDVIRAHRINFKDYSTLLFSIDPGKKLGLMVFLEGYYFYSETFQTKEDLINNIQRCIKYLERDNTNQLDLNFKFGRGVVDITSEFISKIFSIFQKKHKVRVFLINEAYSSKIKLHKLIENISKHEASALILGLRKGIEVKRDNFSKIINQIKSNRILKENLPQETQDIDLIVENSELIKEVFIKLIIGELSINDSFTLINQQKAII